ncbi:hypothetical protein OROGR_017190 [Orobanche gracilis]
MASASSTSNINTINASSSATARDNNLKSTESPLWNHVRVIDRLLDKRGGNVKFECKYCAKNCIGSLSRIKAHLLKIKGQGIQARIVINKDTDIQVKKEVEDEAAAKAQVKPHSFSLPASRSSGSHTSNIGGTAGTGAFRVEGVKPFDQRKRKASITNPLEKLTNNEQIDQLHSEIARMFYSAGLPFHLARNPYFSRY